MRVYSICGPNKENIVYMSVGIVVYRNAGNQRWLISTESWLLPHRDTSRKLWRRSVSIEVTEKIVAKYLLESQLLII